MLDAMIKPMSQCSNFIHTWIVEILVSIHDILDALDPLQILLLEGRRGHDERGVVGHQIQDMRKWHPGILWDSPHVERSVVDKVDALDLQ